MRRVHVAILAEGIVRLSEAEAHHARDVLRIKAGDRVELFDDGGRTAVGNVVEVGAAGVQIVAGTIVERVSGGVTWTIASAVPKGARVDWMIEKLSELGTGRFVPLMTQRSVVHPEGKGKRERWMRIATEAAKQSRRAGVMAIEDLTELEKVIEQVRACSAVGFYCATEAVTVKGALNALSEAARRPQAREIVVLVGPEGGWTEKELGALSRAGLTAITLGTTILRVETAAVAVAAIVAAASVVASSERQEQT